MSSTRLRLWISLGLAALVLIVYSAVWQFDFVDYDDPSHVVTHEHVRDGLTVANVAYVFTHYHAAQWIPLTWVSHMVDVSLFGMDPGPHHLMNVAFHFVNVLLLFAVLLRMTGALWRSAIVAALFAVHPLNVESVAWIAERKNVLNTACWLLALLCYAHYAEKKRPLWMVATTLCMAAGVMSKAMIVTFPFTLLLLDGWPLRRFGTASWQRLLGEKVALFALSAFGCWVQMKAGAAAQLLWTQEASPIPYRIACAAANALTYLGQLFLPVGLALPYPMQRETPVSLALTAFVVFGGLAFLAWRRRGAAPYALMGLLWFLGTLMPVSGIVQAGDTAFANRYAYIPQIGIFIAVVWMGAAFLREQDRRIAHALVTACLGIFAVLSARYVACWENTVTLFTHAAGVLPGSKAHGIAALALARAGRFPESLVQYRAALELNPHDSEVRANLGVALSRMGNLDDAIEEFRSAAVDENPPGFATFNLGTHLLRKSSAAEAVPVLETVVRSTPADPIAHYWLGQAYEATARPEDAIREYQQALALKPYDTSIQEALRRLAGKEVGDQ